MNLFKRIFNCATRHMLPLLVLGALVIMPTDIMAAELTLVDKFNLAPFVPIVLDALMMVASGGYDFFVGNGDGIIYIFVWGFLGVSMALYLLKMYFPKIWVGFFGFSGGGKIDDPETIAMNLLKPAFRGIIAAVLLLQLRPVYLTQGLINPFLQFGALYTDGITSALTGVTDGPRVECPPDIIERGWISESSCEYLVQPVSTISHANNQVIKVGFDFVLRGLRGLMTPIPHGGEDFLNIITGFILISTFVASNLFMALLIIQAIFDFGMTLVLYPFQVLTYVVKPNDRWFDIWPAFAGITQALQKLIITMIACAFILGINISIIRSLFQWQTSVFVVAAGASMTTNVPTVANSAMGFGNHSVLWLSAILTFYVMFKIFDMTQKQLLKYAGGKGDAMYNQVTGDAKKIWANTQKVGRGIGTAIGWIKNK